MSAPDWQAAIAQQLDSIRSAGQWRELRAFDAFGPTGSLSGRDLVSFASNDYLGLASDPVVIAAAARAARELGVGATASRLIVGDRPIHHRLEEALAIWKKTDRALSFPSGFAANLSVLTTLGSAEVTIFSDELNHASIVDGTRLAKADTVVYRHNDLGHLAELISACETMSLIVSDAVFSMDGDVADVGGLIELAISHQAMLVLDEAHNVGSPEFDPSDFEGLDVVRVGTMSKSLGSQGGFVAASSDVIDLLINRARPFIFTTALAPPIAAAALAALEVLTSDRGQALESKLESHIQRVAPGHPTPIIPIIVGNEQAALAASNALAERGLWVPAIRPPTVAPGTSRLRIALSASHRDEDIDRLINALQELDLPMPSEGIHRSKHQPRDALRSKPIIIGVAGTGTEVGKTFVTAALTRALRNQGLSISTRKPVQSFDPADETPHDSEILAAASGESETDVCPLHRRYPVAMAPTMAAATLGREGFTVDDLTEELNLDPSAALTFVETAGGVASPMTDDGDCRDFIRALKTDAVLLVGDAELGTLNSLRLALEHLDRGPLLVYLNRYDDSRLLHRANRDWLNENDKSCEIFVDLAALATHISTLSRQ